MNCIEELKKYMKDNNLTQWAITQELHVQAATLSRWLLGKSKPGYAWQVLLNKYLDGKRVKE